MKLSSKPKSSPARTDDFQPPLIIEASIMFPRSKSNRGSRSRSNHLFVSKINTGNEANQEPSSPKVSCIGQVRVKRLNNKQTSTTVVRRCKWVRKFHPSWFQRVWREKVKGDHGSLTEPTRTNQEPKPNKIKNKNRRPDRFCVFGAGLVPVRVRSLELTDQPSKCLFLENISFLGCHCCRSSEKIRKQDGTRVEHEAGDVIGRCNDELGLESRPRSVFLLNRSRSAPYRCSFSGNEIWESNIVGEKIVAKEEDEGFINEVKGFNAGVLKLRRCKSEPARIGNKLFVGFSFTS